MTEKIKLNVQQKDVLKLSLSTNSAGTGCNCVIPDHSQNDPAQPDYIKNRLAYYQRKIDDIIPDYTEQRIVEGTMTVPDEDEESSGPMYLFVAPLPENATAAEVIDELNGFVIIGDDEEEVVYLDDPEIFTEELKQYMSYEHFDTLSAFVMGMPYIVAVQEANAVYENAFIDDDYEYSIKSTFPEPGIYSAIIDSDEDESENPVYVGFRKIMFKTAKKLDVELLPKEALSKSVTVDDYPEEYSDNPISSDAVYDLKRDINAALLKKADKLNVTSADNGKILAVVGGAITLASIEQAENEVY